MTKTTARRGRFSPMPVCRTNCGQMSEMISQYTEDAFLGGQLQLRQPKTGHRAGHDAMLLAAATFACPGDRVVEFGSGIGAAGLALARRVRGIDLVLVEIDPGLASLARDNAAANAIAADVAVLDVTSPASDFAAVGLTPDSTDVVLMNPPFNDSRRHRASSDSARAAAHVAAPRTLATWIGAARRILRSGGRLTLIWRAEGLAEVLSELEHGFGSVAILPVHGEATRPAIRVLIGAIKGSKAASKILPALMLNDEISGPNRQILDILAGRRVLPLVSRS